MKKRESKFLKVSTLLFILNIIASALNYLCQLVMARVLSVESYGTINTIFSFMMLMAVPGTTLTMVVAKYYASGGTICGKKYYLKKQLVVVIFLTFAVLFALFLFQKPLAKILSISNFLILAIAFTLAALGYFQPLYSGVFSGNKCFILVGIYSLFIPIYKIIAICAAYFYTDEDFQRLYIILTLMTVGTLITAFYGEFKSNKIIGKDNSETRFEGKLYSSEDANTFILNISLMLYMNIDLLAVRYFGSGTESGLYSSVLLFGRIIYYFATTLGTILLPSVANSKMVETVRKSTLNKVLILLIAFAAICMVPINFLKDVFIRILYGSSYLEAGKYVIYVSIISLALSIYTIMVNYVVGVGKTKQATWIMCIVDVMLILSVILLRDVTIILMAIGVIGITGATAIYILVNKNMETIESKQ